MFLTSHEIAQSRDFTLNNMLGLSSACLDASHRLSQLLASSGRDALHAGSKHFAQFGHGQLETLTHFPAALWLEHSSRTSQLLGNAYEILGETHKMLTHSAEAQIRVLDEITYSSLDRLTRNSPWETAVALKAMRGSLETAEHGWRGVDAAAIGALEMAEQEVQHIAETLSAPPEQKPKATARSRSKAN